MLNFDIHPKRLTIAQIVRNGNDDFQAIVQYMTLGRQRHATGMECKASRNVSRSPDQNVTLAKPRICPHSEVDLARQLSRFPSRAHRRKPIEAEIHASLHETGACH
jgi:hypothetical protein